MQIFKKESPCHGRFLFVSATEAELAGLIPAGDLEEILALEKESPDWFHEVVRQEDGRLSMVLRYREGWAAHWNPRSPCGLHFNLLGDKAWEIAEEGGHLFGRWKGRQMNGVWPESWDSYWVEGLVLDRYELSMCRFKDGARWETFYVGNGMEEIGWLAE